MARPTPAELEAARERVLPPIVGNNCRFLIVGINPSLWSSAVQAPFARPGNRFWPALFDAGITDRLIDASEGLSDAELQQLFDAGIGFTNLVERTTARADELGRDELIAGGEALRKLVGELQPRVVAMVGITSFRTAFRQPKAQLGKQDEPFVGAELWLLPNPSGLNAHETRDSLAAWYRQAYAAACA